ncbi:hypothetical protein IAE35_23550 [Pseudomonas sp. S75]|uniref:hypothetical protein n=1 Tax=unclassified Pseudomonas TaxID=196821 RepID=UPI001902DF45|nr:MULTISPECIES: hypothetical protein [unclassified Pseudomonas]MBJ9978369.1 hypothetical protein [Pseudomonas sp. S30]MBK0156324.1 hypothetical protein [Pseudomonas sp. S75]
MLRFLLSILFLLLTQTALAAPQTLHLGQGKPYDFLAYANHPLQDASLPVRQAVVVLHGVRRNADDYFHAGQALLDEAGLTARDTLLLAPKFLTPADPHTDTDLPLWPKSQWMHGTESQGGRTGIPAFGVLDDLLAYLGDRQRFPVLEDILVIGHSAGGQLLQRYTLLGSGDQGFEQRGIHVRYLVSSPSSYLYLDDNRLQDGVFRPLSGTSCPDYDRYRYGLEQAPAYFAHQGLDTVQVLRRYAARDVTYMIGQRDNNPGDRVMDKACGAMAQGPTRLARQRAYLRYEAFLAQRWQTPVNHPHFEVEGVGHDESRLLTALPVVKTVQASP